MGCLLRMKNTNTVCKDKTTSSYGISTEPLRPKNHPFPESLPSNWGLLDPVQSTSLLEFRGIKLRVTDKNMKTYFVNFPLRPECPLLLTPVSGTDRHSPSLLLKVLGVLSLCSFGPLFWLVNWLIGWVSGGQVVQLPHHRPKKSKEM